MFARIKHVGSYSYLQLVETRREAKQVRQRVVATLGRIEQLQQKGSLENVIESLARFSKEALALICGKKEPSTQSWKVGPVLVFERLWEQTGLNQIFHQLLKGRKFEFDVERTIFTSVLHRLCCSGSDRQADRWKKDYWIKGVSNLNLHHFYRAMAWLGAPLEKKSKASNPELAVRCWKDRVEEALFEQRRDLFTDLSLVFFDTTSLYFEGQGAQSLGRRGKSKDHRPDLKQMVVGTVLDGAGNPICCQLWPGNTTDVKTLIPVAQQLKERFGIQKICVVADRGMISSWTLAELETMKWDYILGARMRSQKEVRDEVIRSLEKVPEGFEVIYPERVTSKDPSPLAVKEVMVGTHRYIVCYNAEQARKDAHDRKAIVQSLKEALKAGDKSLIGNQGYRRLIQSQPPHFQIDEAKVVEESRYDGLWVLRTNTSLPTAQIALRYKELWRVERIFRDTKTLLKTRPIYHKCDETIRGHVFCSFLALVLLRQLDQMLEAKKLDLEWNDILRDLKALQRMKLQQNGKCLWIRSQIQGCCSQVFAAVGLSLPPVIQKPSDP